MSRMNPANFLAVGIGAVAGASLRFILYRRPGSVNGSRRAWIMESVLAFGLGLLAGVVLITVSGPDFSPLGLGAVSAMAAYAGTAFAMSWMGQKSMDQTPVVPAMRLMITLLASLAGAAIVTVMAGKF